MATPFYPHDFFYSSPQPRSSHRSHVSCDDIRNLSGTTIHVSFEFTNRCEIEYLQASVEGVNTTIFQSAEFPTRLKTLILDSNMLGDFKYSVPLVREALNSFEICCGSLLSLLVGKVMGELTLLLSSARQEGFNAIQVRFNIEAVTIYTFEEEIDRGLSESASTGVAGPASRSSIQALSSVVIVDDDVGSSDKCTVCLDEFSAGMTVTRLACPHYFHKECIERWLKESNSCPLCRLSI